MLITTGRVKGGAIEVEAGTLPEGVRVTILAPEDNEVFQLGADVETRLLEAVAEAERGEVVRLSVMLEEQCRKL